MNVITSASNDKIKYLRRLYKDKKERDNTGLYLAEGVTMVKDLDVTDVDSLFLMESRAQELSYLTHGAECFVVKDAVFTSVADTVTPSGVIAVVKKRPAGKKIGPTAVVLCGVADSGNVGAIMRSAYARGIRDLYFVDCADPYSPKAVRASMGVVQKLNLIVTDYESVFADLADYEKLALDADGTDIYAYKRAEKIAFFVGNEAHGVPEEVEKRCDRVLSLPMQEGSVESLNAAVAASIAMYLVR